MKLVILLNILPSTLSSHRQQLLLDTAGHRDALNHSDHNPYFGYRSREGHVPSPLVATRTPNGRTNRRGVCIRCARGTVGCEDKTESVGNIFTLLPASPRDRECIGNKRQFSHDLCSDGDLVIMADELQVKKLKFKK